MYEYATKGLYKGISADSAMAELERIREMRGTLEPEFVVEESRDKNSVLHQIFEWKDTKAAELYRREQALTLIRNIRVVITTNETKCSIRAIVNVRQSEDAPRTYIPVIEIKDNDVAYQDLLSQSKREMQSFVAKYSRIEELNTVKAAMLSAINAITLNEE